MLSKEIQVIFIYLSRSVNICHYMFIFMRWAKVFFNILAVFMYSCSKSASAMLVGGGEVVSIGGRCCISSAMYCSSLFVLSDAMYSTNTEYVAISASTNCLVKKGYRHNRGEWQNCLKNHIRQQMPCFWLNAGVNM